MLPSERKKLEKLNKKKRSSLVFKKIYGDVNGKRQVIRTEKYSKADIRDNPNSAESKKAIKFFSDRDKKIDSEIKSISGKITDRRKKSGNLTGGLSNIASSISDNINVDNALTAGSLLLRGTPLGVPLGILSIANRLNNFFNKDDRQGGMSFDAPRDFRNRSQVADVANLQDNIIPTVTPTVTSRQGGMSFDAIPSLLNANRVSSVFPQVLGTERVQTGTRDVQVPTGRQRGDIPATFTEQQPVFEDRDIVSSGLLQLLGARNIGQDFMQRYDDPRQGGMSFTEPRESDIAFAPANNITGLLGTQNIGQDFMQRYNVPQDFAPRIETSPVEIRNILNPFEEKSNVTDRLLATVQERLGDDYILPPVSQVGDPVTLTNPILFGEVPDDYIPTFKDNITPTISLLATTGGQDIRANQLTPDNQREFFELLSQFRGQAPLGLNIGFQ